jgi:hypothetical protein
MLARGPFGSESLYNVRRGLRRHSTQSLASASSPLLTLTGITASWYGRAWIRTA